MLNMLFKQINKRLPVEEKDDILCGFLHIILYIILVLLLLHILFILLVIILHIIASLLLTKLGIKSRIIT